ncbi:MAG: hypothetical protein NT166_31885 [Candidatus Aminicenantes bacterium]|nr:hypothetical protein [Candidatus Aminicenantes bacterium]
MNFEISSRPRLTVPFNLTPIATEKKLIAESINHRCTQPQLYATFRLKSIHKKQQIFLKNSPRITANSALMDKTRTFSRETRENLKTKTAHELHELARIVFSALPLFLASALPRFRSSCFFFIIHHSSLIILYKIFALLLFTDHPPFPFRIITGAIDSLISVYTSHKKPRKK